MAVENDFELRMRRWRERQGPLCREGLLEVQVGLDRAAVMVAVLGHEKWAQWTVYFLEVVDALLGESHVSEELREEFLRRVRDSISDRLGADGW